MENNYDYMNLTTVRSREKTIVLFTQAFTSLDQFPYVHDSGEEKGEKKEKKRGALFNLA